MNRTHVLRNAARFANKRQTLMDEVDKEVNTYLSSIGSLVRMPCVNIVVILLRLRATTLAGVQALGSKGASAKLCSPALAPRTHNGGILASAKFKISLLSVTNVLKSGGLSRLTFMWGTMEPCLGRLGSLEGTGS